MNTLTYFLLVVCIVLITLVYYLQNINEPFQTKPIVTFVIPSIGRPTIDRTLYSLLQQTNPQWEALVVYDGVDRNLKTSDPRIRVIHTKKNGTAGATRNAAIPHIHTEWVAFVDDDDSLSPDYIEKLIETIHRHADVDVVIFRMMYENGRVLPEKTNTSTLYKDSVGISFAIRHSVFAEIPFKLIHAEDFYLLQDVFRKGKHIVLSEYLTYAIRAEDKDVLNKDYWEQYKQYRAEFHNIQNVVE